MQIVRHKRKRYPTLFNFLAEWIQILDFQPWFMKSLEYYMLVSHIIVQSKNWLTFEIMYVNQDLKKNKNFHLTFFIILDGDYSSSSSSSSPAERLVNSFAREQSLAKNADLVRLGRIELTVDRAILNHWYTLHSTTNIPNFSRF